MILRIILVVLVIKKQSSWSAEGRKRRKKTTTRKPHCPPWLIDTESIDSVPGGFQWHSTPRDIRTARCQFQQRVQFNSRWYLCAWESRYALHAVSQKFSQLCLWNGSIVRLIDDGRLSLFQGRSSSVSSFHASLLQATEFRSCVTVEVAVLGFPS